MPNDFILRDLPETKQILITARTRLDYLWLKAQIERIEGARK
jgi:hypothetical protein